MKMVVFTCNHCGDSLQKPKVEKHYSVHCRTVKFLTCIDCLKDFKNEEYVAHTKCFTEDERYAAKGSHPNGIAKKGEVKQETWLEMIKSIISKGTNLRPSVNRLLHTISTYTNVPRKKTKFINFLRSSSGGRVNLNDAEEAWNVIEKYKHESSENKVIKDQENNKRKLDDQEKQEKCADEPLKKKVNRSDTNGNGVEAAVFSFKETITSILNKNGDTPLKKLQKKVLNRYTKETGNEVTEKTIKKYNKKLSKTPNVEIENDIVKIRNK